MLSLLCAEMERSGVNGIAGKDESRTVRKFTSGAIRSADESPR